MTHITSIGTVKAGKLYRSLENTKKTAEALRLKLIDHLKHVGKVKAVTIQIKALSDFLIAPLVNGHQMSELFPDRVHSLVEKKKRESKQGKSSAL